MKRLTHGRAPVGKSMPPIAEACAEFKGFKESEKRLDRIFEVLSVVIQRYRRSKPQRFYAMREVAAFFGVSLDTAATVYRRLDREGVLTRMRSSQTMIAPRTPRPRFAVRGVVCMPVWLPGFLQFADLRRSFSQLEEELSSYHFVVEPVFYQQSEEITPAFVERLLKFNPDYVLWHDPHVTDITTMQSIADTGVPLVVIEGKKAQFPGRIYRISYERALRQGLRNWAGGEEVDDIVVAQRRVGSNSVTRIVDSILKTSSLPYRFEYYPAETSPVPAYLKRLAPNPRTGIIFDDDLFYSRASILAPEMMLNLFRKHRVMVMREVTIPCVTLPEVTVDALVFPWKRLARRIAMDLSKARGAIPAEQSTTEAEWRPRLPLAKVAQFDFHH